MAGIIDFIQQANKKFQFLKWVQIIPQESLATKKSALYFVEKNDTEVDAIVIDDLGQKRKLTGGGITIDLKASNVVNDSLVVGLSVKDALETITQMLSDEEQARIIALEGKVDKTTSGISVPDSTFKYAYIFDEANNTRRMLAGDLGKNIANSSLTSVTGAGMTLGAPYTWNAASQPFSITGLPDKSSDITFDRIKVQNSLGQEAMATSAYGLLKSTFGKMTAEQSLELGQLLNGGVGSAGNMSVNLISPPIVQKIDSIEYILLRGANLNLNATSKKIEILNSVTKAVVVTIPDNQIQLNADGLSLIFYYNFKDFNIGEFVIRLTSGVKVYDTSLTLKTVTSVVNIKLDALVWELAYAPTTTPKESDSAAGRNVAITTPITGASAIPSVSAKSQELFAQGDDFYIEFNVNLGYKSSGNTQELNKTYIGIGYSNSPNTLSPNSLINLSYGYSNNDETIAWNNNIQVGGSEKSPRSITVIIIKTGNLFRTVIGSTNHQATLSNNSGYSMFINLVPRDAGAQVLQTQIIKAYKFN